MQTSGTAPCLSDGTRKTITTKAPLTTESLQQARGEMKKPGMAIASNHRRGGFAKHAKGGK